MENRKTSQVTAILDYTLEMWDLSINEQEVLDSLLIVLARNDVKKLKQVQLLLNNETEELLETLNEREVIKYAENELDLISNQDEDSLVDALDDLNFKWIDKVDEDDMINYLEENGYYIEANKGNLDIITDSQLEEMNDLFLSFSAEKRQEIINNLK